jgi:hypothetical protein
MFVEGKREARSQQGLQSCNFGITQFNTVKRSPLPPESVLPDVPMVPRGDAVLLLDLDGQVVSSTSWNYNGDIVCSPANLSPTAINEIVSRITEDFSAFEITITTNENIYNEADPFKRMRVIITETWEWFGQAGGVAFIGSFNWGNNTPCFVFSVLLNYNTKKIAEAISHEAGHTLGLYHQSLYSPVCSLLSEYYSGLGTGELSWGPIMGVGYNRNMTTWRRGTSIYGCSNIQDDVNVIENMLDNKHDDHSNDFALATRIEGNYELGCINILNSNNADVDFFLVELSRPSAIVISPFNVGSNNEGANIDLKAKVYTFNRNLITTLNDPLCLSVGTTLLPGRYYISVESTENINTSRYGQLGNYSVAIN